MKIFVVGASGNAGTELVKSLVNAGHEVVAGSRHPENVVKSDHVTAVQLDVHDPVNKLAQTVGKVDAIYFVAGNLNDLYQTDAFGAIKLMNVAEQNGIKRFVLLSAAFVPEPSLDSLLDYEGENPDPGIMDYSLAKFFAENYLVNNTKLDYTIVKPEGITPGPGTGKITIDNGSQGSISFADLGQTMADFLKYPNTIHQVIKLKTGSTPIDQALAKL